MVLDHRIREPVDSRVDEIHRVHSWVLYTYAWSVYIYLQITPLMVRRGTSSRLSLASRSTSIYNNMPSPNSKFAVEKAKPRSMKPVRNALLNEIWCLTWLRTIGWGSKGLGILIWNWNVRVQKTFREIWFHHVFYTIEPPHCHDTVKGVYGNDGISSLTNFKNVDESRITANFYGNCNMVSARCSKQS